MLDYGTDHPDPMAPDGAELLDEVHEWHTSYVAYPSEHAGVVVTLWAAHTHLAAEFDSTPRLTLVSPEPGCGKTRVLELLELVCPGGWLIIGPSASALFRRVHLAHTDEPRPVTLLLDEADTIWKAGKGDESAEALRQIVNAGHRKRATVPRSEPTGGKVALREFRVYAPTAIASKGDALPDTIMSRSVVVRMRRRAPDETVRGFRERTAGPEGEALRDRLTEWATDVAPKVGDPWPQMPDGVTDRPADIWEPLLAVADLAGGDWPARAREACASFVSSASQADDTSLGVRLLTDLFAAFRDGHDLLPAVSTEIILSTLHAMDEAPWADWYGKPFSARNLAKMLKPYGIGSKVVRIGDETARGYRREDMWDAWSRYGVLADPSVTSVTSVTALASTVTHVTDVTDRTQNAEGDQPWLDLESSHTAQSAGAPSDPATSEPGSGGTTAPDSSPAGTASPTDTTKLSGSSSGTPCTDPTHSPRLRDGVWTCPDCEQDNTA